MNPEAYAITQAQLDAAAVREPLTADQWDWLVLCGCGCSRRSGAP